MTSSLTSVQIQLSKALDDLAPLIAADFGLSIFETDDVRQDAATSILSRLSESELKGLIDRGTLKAYVRTSIRNATRSYLRRVKLERTTFDRSVDLESTVARSSREVPSPELENRSELQGALRLIARIRDRVGPKGRLALDISCGIGNLAAYAAENQITDKRARIHLVEGWEAVASTVMWVLQEDSPHEAWYILQDAFRRVRRMVDREPQSL